MGAWYLCFYKWKTAYEIRISDCSSDVCASDRQRCYAARVLYVQEDIADKVVHMLAGAMAELQVGDPALLSTDVGPVIDKDALCMLDEHAARMQTEGKLIARATLEPEATAHGTFFEIGRESCRERVWQYG